MANFSALKTAIQNAIKQNGNEEITGDVLQQILLSIVSTMGDGSINTIEQNLSQETLARQNGDNTLQSNINAEALARGNADTQLQNAINAIKANIDNGYVYAGIATPSSTPVSGKVFYIATSAGTYTNFGGQVLTQGINIMRFNGSAWSSQQLIGIDDVPTAGSNSLVKSGGVQNELALGAVYDVSAKNPTGGPNSDGKWESLSALLSDANLNTLIPTAYRKGGMSIKFVQSSDNKYVQYMSTSLAFNTDPIYWQKQGAEITVSQNTNTKGQQLYSGGTKLCNVNDVFNINSYRNTIEAYPHSTSARNEVPTSVRANGLIITYLLADGWHIEQYIGSDLEGWLTASNWKDFNNILLLLNKFVGIDNFSAQSITKINGYYINSKGNLVANAGYSYTQPLAVHAGDMIAFVTGAGASVAIICETDSNGTYRKPMQMGGSTDAVKLYTAIALRDGYVTFCGITSRLDSSVKISNSAVMKEVLSDYMNSIDELDSLIGISNFAEKQYTKNDGAYITRVGNVSQLSGYSYTNPIAVSRGDILKFYVGAEATVSALSQTNANGSYHTPLMLGKGSTQQVYYGIAINDGYVCLSGLTSRMGNLEVSHSSFFKELLDKCANNTEISFDLRNQPITKENPLTIVKETGGMATIFHNWGFIGDSLCSGEIYIPDSSPSQKRDMYAFSWGQALCRLCGSKGTNFSKGGLTAKSWWDEYIDGSGLGWNADGVSTSFVSDVKNQYVIALGTNDDTQGIAVGDITTDVNYSDFTQNANTFAGNYAKIIQKIHSLRPNARIFVVTIPKLWRNGVETNGYNDIIRSMPELFNFVYLLDVQAYLPYTAELTDHYVRSGHMTTQGYQWFAYVMATFIDYYVNNNPSDFITLGLVNTDIDDGTL